MNALSQPSLQLSMPSQAAMYRAIAERDPAYDGRFVYGVVTTGVYCRPSCNSRAARRENLRLFTDPAAARRAGYRACRRCHPDRTEGPPELLIDIARHIVEHADQRLPLQALAERAGLSASRLQKAFKTVFGVSPKAFQDAVRLDSFRDALKNGADVTDAIFAAGFGSVSRVYGEAGRSLGMTPSAYRAGGKGESIAYACRETAFGPLLMAATERGVCFVHFGVNFEELEQALDREFPNAEITRSPGSRGHPLDDWMEALDAHLGRSAPRPDLPLDLYGTAFQLKVWRFLLGLDAGEVVSYGELAAGIGQPGAVRAAASACGANRVAVLVPCHRVLKATGEIGGYRWGPERKRALLDMERSQGAAEP